MRSKLKEYLAVGGVGTVLVAGIGGILYGAGQGILYLSDGGTMGALVIFGSVCAICATVIYLVQAEQSGRNKVKQAEANKQVERILRADRVIDHK
jgi:hypothetical protein